VVRVEKTVLEERCLVSRDLTTRSVIFCVFVITVLNVLSAQNEYATLSYYTCKLAVCTMESIVFRLRKTGLQKKPVLETLSTIIRWTDRSRVPKWLRHLVLGQFGSWSLRTFKKERSDQRPK